MPNTPRVALCSIHVSATYWILQSLSLGYRIGRLSEMLSGFSIFCYQCLTLLEWHFVLSTCPLHPLPGWYDIVAELRLIRTQTGASTCPLRPLPGWYDVVAELRFGLVLPVTDICALAT